MKPDVRDELEVLRDNLVTCAELYLTTDLPTQRLAVTSALLEVAKYLEAHDFPPETLLPIIRPALALAERQNNALDKMFSQRHRKGRPSATMDEHMRTAILAVFANAWLRLRQGDDSKQAVKLAEAARNMRGRWFGNISGATLKTAREIISGEAKDHMAVEFFEKFSTFFEKVVATIGLSRTIPLMVRYINEHPVSPSMGILKTIPFSPAEEE